MPPPLGVSAPTKEENLWNEAKNSLCEKERKALDNFHPSERGQQLKAILDSVESTKARYESGKSGTNVKLRKVSANIVLWVQRFVSVGSVVSSYDPVHAALPWAGVMLILQTKLATAKHEYTLAMLEGLERMSRCITYYRRVEEIYLGTSNIPERALSTPLDTEELRKALIKLYAGILRWLGSAAHYYNSNSMGRFRLSFRKGSLDDNLASIESYESQVQKFLGSQTYESLCEIFDERKRNHQEVMDSLNHLKTDNDKRDVVQGNRDALEERQKILQELSSIQYSANHETTRAGRLDQSGTWLLKRQEFVNWSNSPESSILWLHGKPGSGKSSLASIVIDSIPKSESSVYFYCSAEATQKPRSQPEQILRCILKQLYASSEEKSTEVVTETFREWEKQNGDYTRISHMSVQESTDCILEILKHHQSPVKMVIDALDECDPRLRAELIGSFERIINQAGCPVKIFLSSRDDVDIVRRLSGKINVYIQASDNQQDIVQFIENGINDLALLPAGLSVSQSVKLKSEIKARLEEKAGGMFRWVSLQLQTIARLKTVPDIHNQLENLPEGLEESYDAVYQQIETSAAYSKSLAERTFGWLLCMQMELPCETFLLAVSEGSETSTLTKDTIVDVCCNLVFLDESTDAFRFVHLSAQEYLQKFQGYSSEKVHTAAAKTCLSKFLSAPLSAEEEADLQSLNDEDFESRPKNSKFVWRLYTAIKFPDHLQHADTSSDDSLQEDISWFVASAENETPFQRWVRILQDFQNLMESPQRFGKLFLHDFYYQLWLDVLRLLDLKNPLELAASFGIIFLARKCFESQTAALTDLAKQKSIIEASLRNHITMLRMLLHKGFVPDLDTLRKVLERVENNSKGIFTIIVSFIETELTENVLIVAIKNNNNCVELVREVLRHRKSTFKITNESLSAAVLKRGNSGGKLLSMLLDKNPNLEVSQEVLKAAASRYEDAKILTSKLLEGKSRARITPEVLLAAVSNKAEDSHTVVELLLQKTTGVDPDVNQEILEAAIGRPSGAEAMVLTLFESKYPPQATPEILVAAVSRGEHVVEITRALLLRCDKKDVKEGILAKAASHREKSYELTKLLFEWSGRLHAHQSMPTINTEPYQTSEKILKAAVQNERQGFKVTKFLVEEVKGFCVSQAVVEAAAANKGHSRGLLDFLVTQKPDFEVNDIFLAILIKADWPPSQVSQLLSTLGTRSRITGKALLAAICDRSYFWEMHRLLVSDQISICAASTDYPSRDIQHAARPVQVPTHIRQIIVEDHVEFFLKLARLYLDVEDPQSRLFTTFLCGNGRAMVTDDVVSALGKRENSDRVERGKTIKHIIQDLENSSSSLRMKFLEQGLANMFYHDIRTLIFPQIRERITDTMIVSAMRNQLHGQQLVLVLMKMRSELGDTQLSDVATLDIMNWRKHVVSCDYEDQVHWLNVINTLFKRKAFLPDSPVFRVVLRTAVSQDCAALIQALWENKVPMPESSDLEELVQCAISERRFAVLSLFLRRRLISSQHERFGTAVDLVIEGGDGEELLEEGIIEGSSTEESIAEESVAEESVAEESIAEEDDRLLQSAEDETDGTHRIGDMDENEPVRQVGAMGDMAVGHETEIARVTVGRPLVVLLVLLFALIMARIIH